MGKWSTILGIGKKVANHSATQTTARSIGGALVHPQRTLAGLGNATKTAVMGGGMGYLAWEKLVNDKPVVRAAADLLVGEEAVDKGLEMAGNATNKIADAADKAGESLQEVQQFARHTNISTTQIYAHNLDRAANKCEAVIADAIF